VPSGQRVEPNTVEDREHNDEGKADGQDVEWRPQTESEKDAHDDHEASEEAENGEGGLHESPLLGRPTLQTHGQVLIRRRKSKPDYDRYQDQRQNTLPIKRVALYRERPAGPPSLSALFFLGRPPTPLVKRMYTK